MADREETDLRRGVPTQERAWKEYSVELVMDFMAYEGDELTQAQALTALIAGLTAPVRVYLKYPNTYPSES